MKGSSSSSSSNPRRFGLWESPTWDDHFKNQVIPHMRTHGATIFLEQDFERDFTTYASAILIPPPPLVRPPGADEQLTEAQRALRTLEAQKSAKLHNEYNLSLSKLRVDHTKLVGDHDKALSAFNACCRAQDVKDMEQLEIKTVFQRLKWVKERYALNDSKGQTRHGWAKRLHMMMKQRPVGAKEIREWYSNVSAAIADWPRHFYCSKEDCKDPLDSILLSFIRTGLLYTIPEDFAFKNIQAKLQLGENGGYTTSAELQRELETAFIMYNQKLAYGGEISERRSNRTSQGAGWSTSQDHITSPSVDVEMVEVAAPAQLSQRKRAHNAGQKGNTQKRVKGDNSQPGPSRSRPQPTRSASARAQDSDRSSTDLKPGENGTCPFHGKWVKHPQAKCYTFANVIIPTSTESARSGVLTSNLPPPPPPPFVSTSATTEIGHTQALTARGVSSALDSFIAHYCTVPTPYGPFPYTVLVNMLPYDVTAATQRFITESMPPDFQKTTPAPLDSNDLSPETPSFGLRRLSLSEPTLNLDDLTKDLFSANSACVLPSEEFTSVPSWPVFAADLPAGFSAARSRYPAILDSGATRTISSCLSFFTNLRPHSAAVVIADGTRCLSQQIGDFHFQVDGVSFSLPDTLYIPEFRKTLISVNHLLLHTGAQMFFTAQHAALRRPGARDLIFAVLHGPSYAVLMRPSLRLPQHRGAGATIDEPMVGDAHPVTPIPLSSI